jgi:APA family basic amino acid/polyamine antiporter
MFKGATILFFSYLGFDLITTLAEDSKNPARDIPISIKLTIFISMAYYVLVAISMCSMARLETFAVPELALAEAFNRVDNRWVTQSSLILL